MKPDLEKWKTAGFWKTATVESVADCLELGANPNAKDKNGLPPLHFAAIHNKNPAVIKALLEAGADPNARALCGETPLHEAARSNGNPAVVTALLEAGANPKARTKRGNILPGSTPLHQAAMFNQNPAIIKILVKAGADTNAQAVFRQTPLHLAALCNNPAVVTTLLDAGADPRVQDTNGNTPWDLSQDNETLKNTDALWHLKQEQKSPSPHEAAERRKNRKVPNFVKILIGSIFVCGFGAYCSFQKGSESLKDCREWNSMKFWMTAEVETVKDCLKAGADPNEVIALGFFFPSPILQAASFLNKNPKVIMALIEAGADINAKDEDGRTSIHAAAFNNDNPAIIKTLAEAGADINAKDENGVTPLHMASMKNSIAVMTVLLEEGANPKARTESGETVLDWMARNKDPEVIGLLEGMRGATNWILKQLPEKERSRLMKTIEQQTHGPSD